MMTPTQENIPVEYKPYDNLNFCSNILQNVRFLISDKGFYPLLIGKGSIPKIWLYAKNSDGKSINLVNKSISHLPALSVNVDDDNKKLSLVIYNNYRSNIIMLLDYSNDTPLVEELDLVRVGYNIKGDKSYLSIGGTSYSNNTLKNVDTFIALG